MTTDELKVWLQTWVAEALGKPVEEIALDKHLMEYGLESAKLIGMAGDLEDELDRVVDPDFVIRFPTIDELARAINGEIEE